jgi:undecaprenyl diphosphate synthase
VLFSYLKDYLIKNKVSFNKQGIRVNFIGRRDRFTQSLLKEMRSTEELTKFNSTLLVNIALDYGGKWDIINATAKLAQDIVRGKKMIDEINEETFAQHLALADIAPVDLLIRTSGEYRISNFILWDIAYSELYFTSCLWPDFDKDELKKAIDEYASRERRFGKVSSH